MSDAIKIATVTLNPAIDQTVSIPDFQAGQVNRVERTQSDPGGKGVNVAWFLTDYGFQTAATGFLGQENPALFEQLFARKNIVDCFVRIAGSTRTGIKISDEVNQETTDINFPGQAPTETDIQKLYRIVEELTADHDWFVLSGSLPRGVPPDIYAELIQRIKGQGRAVALDTSGEALRQALPASPTLIKPNIDELAELGGHPLDSQAAVVEAAQRWLATGIKTVVVSMGAKGALFVEAETVILARPPKVTVKSTVGAGDAMVSGTVAAKTQGAPLADTARLATAFSLSAVTNLGAGLPSLEAIETFKSQVTINTLEPIK